MAVRIRKDGTILCAAMHPAEEGDTYIDDGLHYKLSVELWVLVTEPMDSEEGRGGHRKHGQWWWLNEVPDDVVIEDRISRQCVIEGEGGNRCGASHCLAQMRCPEKDEAMKRMRALLLASTRVRDGTMSWLRGAPTHVLAELLAELEKSGWTLTNPDEGVVDGRQ